MNGMQNQMSGTWHATYGVNDRQRVIQILSSTLKDVQSGQYDEQKAAAMALDFEKYTFLKASSRDEYLKMIKAKVTQLRQGRAAPAAAAPKNDASMPYYNRVARNPQGQPQSQPIPQAQPQAQVQQLHQPQAPPQSAPQTQQQLLQPTQQQIQQISAMIRTVPIPSVLLAKIPNLPPNVNTWPQIYDCFQRKVIPSSVMPAVKEIHNAHLQLALRQHQLQKLAQFRRMSANGDANFSNVSNMNFNMGNSGMNTTSNVNANMNQNLNANVNQNMSSNANLNMNVGNMNMSNMNLGADSLGTNMGANMGNGMGNMGMNKMSTGNMNVGMNMNRMGNQVNNNQVNSQINNVQMNNQINTAQMNNTQMNQNHGQMNQGLNNLGGVTQNLGQNMGNVSQNMGQNMNMNNMNQNLSANHNMSNMNQFRNKQVGSVPAQKQMNPAAQPVPPKNGQPNIPITLADLAKYSADAMALLQRLQQNGSALPNMDQAQRLNFVRKYIYHQKMNALKAKPSQAPIINATPKPQLLPQVSQANPQMQNASQMQNNMSTYNQRGSVSLVLPPLTDEMKVKLHALFEEVARNNLQLRDMTHQLSEADKAKVKDTMTRIAQQFANVDSVLSYFYVLTRNIDGTKRLIQMKHMTKTIIESLQNEVYLAGPDLAEKMRGQYQKYFDYVKDQFQQRRQQQARPQPGQPAPQPAGQAQMPQPTQPPQPQSQLVGQTQHPMQQLQLQQQQPQRSAYQQQFAMQQQQQQQQHQQQQQQQQHQQVPAYGANALNQQQFMRTNMGQQQKMQQIGSSPGLPVVSPTKATFKANMPKDSAPPARRKSAKPPSAIPTPAATVPTPATLANAIKTPNSIPTPQIPQTHSNKGTPVDNLPHFENKGAVIDKVPFGSEVFGTSGTESKLLRRRELSNLDPEKFFFSALANLLELEEKTEGKISSPLLPKVPGEWTCGVKPYALVTAFRQVDTIRELTSSDVLEDFAQAVNSESKREPRVKREREEEDDIDQLFGEKKPKDNDFGMYEPVEFDEWKSWLSGLQS